MIHSSLIPYQNQPPYTLWCNWCTVYNTRVCYTIICLRKCVWECPWAPLHPTLPYFTTKFWCLNCPSVYPKVADFSTQFYTITRSGCGREHNGATPGQKRYNPCNKYSLPLPSSPQLSHIHPLFLLTFCPAFPHYFSHLSPHSWLISFLPVSPGHSLYIGRKICDFPVSELLLSLVGRLRTEL